MYFLGVYCVSTPKSLRNSGKIESRKLSLVIKPQSLHQGISSEALIERTPASFGSIFFFFFKAEKTQCFPCLGTVQSSSNSTVCSQQIIQMYPPHHHDGVLFWRTVVNADVRTTGSHFYCEDLMCNSNL